MKITSNYNINFGSKRIYSAILNQRHALGVSSNRKVFISELEYSDRQKIEEMYKHWKGKMFGVPILSNFYTDTYLSSLKLGKSKRYFVIETQRPASPKNMKGIAVAEILSDRIIIRMIQAHSPNKLKGVGSCIVYAITKLAHKKNKDFVSLISTREATEFYKKLGFTPVPPDGSKFDLSKSSFDELEKKLESRYSITSVL